MNEMTLIERFEELVRENERLKMEIATLKSSFDILQWVNMFSDSSESSENSEE